MTPRARARAVMRGMAAGAEGPRLRSRWRRISAGRIAHVCLRTVEFAAALFIVGGLVLASVLARGPIRLVGLHDQIEASLKERVGDSYALTLGPTSIMHDSWGVGLGFKGLTLRVAADGALSLAVANDSGAAPIPLPGATPEAGGAPDLAALVRFAAEAMAG